MRFLKRWMLQRAVLALVTGGTLTCTGTVDAQAPGSGVERAPSTGYVSAEVRARQAARAAEIKIALAWMANPATCPLSLDARVIGNHVEVRGFVPNQAVRQVALKTAKDMSGLTVIDGLRSYNFTSLHPANKSPEALQRDAVTALRQVVPSLTRRIQLTVSDDGHISLQGMVVTLEDKLTVGRCLQRVPGCNAVINDLEVRQSFESKAVASSQPVKTVTTVAVAQPLEIVPALQPRPLQATSISTRPVADSMPYHSSNDSVATSSSWQTVPNLATGPAKTSRTEFVAVDPHPVNQPSVASAPAIKQVSGQVHANEGSSATQLPVPPPAKVKPATPDHRALEHRLQVRIAAACGKLDKDVQVVANSDKSIQVRIKTQSTLEGEGLSEKVFGIPELRPFSVSLDVVVE